MKRLISVLAVVLVGAVMAMAATTRTTTASAGTHPPTRASLMDAYVAAAKYWQHRPLSGLRAPSVEPPTTASVTDA